MRKDLNVFDFLAQIPWWVSVTLSASFYLFFQYAIPYFENQSSIVNDLHVSIGPVLAPVVALALLAPVSFSFLKSSRRRKLHDLREEIKSIQDLSWPQFKELVAKAYNHAGYSILESDPFVSDPSVDFVMRKSANLFLLQSRYWRNRKLGLREVKNLSSLMHDKQASGVFLLTTGIFSNEARRYAVGRPINLIDGIKLVKLLDTVKNEFPPGPSH